MNDRQTVKLMVETYSFEQQMALAIPNLLRYGEILLRNRHDAEDLAQEVVFRALKKRSQYDPKKGSVASWLRGFSVHILREKQRKGKEIPWDTHLFDSLIGHWEKTEENEPLQALQICLEFLSQEDQKLLHLRYYNGYMLGDLSRSLGKTVAATKVYLHRLRKALLQCVESKIKEYKL